jgi:hypothetical protein
MRNRSGSLPRHPNAVASLQPEFLGSVDTILNQCPGFPNAIGSNQARLAFVVALEYPDHIILLRNMQVHMLFCDQNYQSVHRRVGVGADQHVFLGGASDVLSGFLCMGSRIRC